MTEMNYHSSGTDGSGAYQSDASDNLIIGNQADGTNHHDGRIADVRIYTRILTQNEMLHVKASKVHGDEAGFWPIFGVASPEPDLSGNGNNGTITGATQANSFPRSPFTKTRSFDAKMVMVSTLPDAPSGFVLESNSPTTARLEWIDNSSDETAFRIYRSTDGSSFTLVGVTDPDAVLYIDPGLTASTKYWYYVVAYNGTAESGPTETKTVVTHTCDSGSFSNQFIHLPTMKPGDDPIQKFNELAQNVEDFMTWQTSRSQASDQSSSPTQEGTKVQEPQLLIRKFPPTQNVGCCFPSMLVGQSCSPCPLVQIIQTLGTILQVVGLRVVAT
jgi:hypothetical protein